MQMDIDRLRKIISNNDKIVMFQKPFNLNLLKDNYSQSCALKPDGLWYSCGIDWIEWTQDNQPNWLGEYIYKLRIDSSGMEIINTENKFTEFYDKYKCFEPNLRNYAIQWDALSNTKDGIEICPYFWNFRHKHLWYYTWDVASGCIWNASIIKDIIPI